MTSYSTQTLQSAAAAIGNGSAMSDLKEVASVLAVVSGTFVGTITWEVSDDGTNWTVVMATPLATGTKASTATAPGVFAVPTLGVDRLRARVSAYTSGSITVTARPTGFVVYP